jgi:hypothetical protein
MCGVSVTNCEPPKPGTNPPDQAVVVGRAESGEQFVLLGFHDRARAATQSLTTRSPWRRSRGEGGREVGGQRC